MHSTQSLEFQQCGSLSEDCSILLLTSQMPRKSPVRDQMAASLETQLRPFLHFLYTLYTIPLQHSPSAWYSCSYQPRGPLSPSGHVPLPCGFSPKVATQEAWVDWCSQQIPLNVKWNFDRSLQRRENNVKSTELLVSFFSQSGMAYMNNFVVCQKILTFQA